jgi:GxxExxY protein
MPGSPVDENVISGLIIGTAIEGYKHLGPGLLAAIYRDGLTDELKQRGVKVEKEVTLPVMDKGMEFPVAYRADLIVEGLVLVELKAVDMFSPFHTAQVLTYLRLSGLRLGLLINFNVPLLADGVKRVVNKLWIRCVLCDSAASIHICS